MDIKIELDQTQIDLISKIPLFVQFQATDKCLKAMAKPVIERAKALAPSSRSTGTRKKWGKRKTAHFDPATWSRDDSGKHISSKVKKYQRGGIIWVGATYPRGNKQQFLTPKAESKVAYFWGKPGQLITRRGSTFVRLTNPKTKRYPKAERFIQKAYDETKSQQIAAFTAELNNIVANIGAANG